MTTPLLSIFKLGTPSLGKPAGSARIGDQMPKTCLAVLHAKPVIQSLLRLLITTFDLHSTTSYMECTCACAHKSNTGHSAPRGGQK